MEIEHFSHEHRLVPREYQEEDDGGSVHCACCDLALVSDPSYRCIDRSCKYFLHKSCAELPRNTIHLMHQKHPVTLLPCPPNDDCKCDACHRPFKTGFTYNCSLCEFNIDLRCATLPLTVKHESHEHPFTLLPKSVSFDCDACGITSDGISYLCPTCLLWVHPECAALPHFVKNERHKHLLYLTGDLPVSQYDYNECQICRKEVNLDYWFYYCGGCTYIAHVACATSNIEPIRDFRALIETNRPTMVATKSLDSINEDLVKIRLRQETVAGKIYIHAIHEHSLYFRIVPPENKKCNGCTRPILTPYYNCRQCEFSLHISCAQLPSKLKHFLHQEHELTLLPKFPDLDGMFWCEACSNICNGFTYSCDECKFNLDVACSFVKDTLKHDGHEHLLLLGQETSCEQCSACGEDCVGFTYGCADCNFRLDISCATLPRRAEHIFHRHTLSLAFSTIDDGSDEYYCDACEEPRNPDHWIYNCARCDLSAHLGCMRGKYPYVKFGGTYKRDSHPHPLTFVQKKKDNSKCNACGCRFEIWALECSECKFNIHWMCPNPTEDDAMEGSFKEKRSTDLQHFTHDHSLTRGFVQNKIETCFGCKLYLVGPCYYCQTCSVYLHRQCAEAPPFLRQHWCHPQHTLNLSYFKWPQHLFKCNLCQREGKNYCYECKECFYHLHIQCSVLPETLLRHNYHFTLTNIADKSQAYSCAVCRRKINSSFPFYHTGDSNRSLHIGCIYRSMLPPPPRGIVKRMIDRSMLPVLPPRRGHLKYCQHTIPSLMHHNL